MPLSQEQRRMRQFTQQFREEQARNGIAEWTGVEVSAVAKWSFGNSADVKATQQLMSYPPFARVKAGNVHSLLKALVHSATSGNRESITDFKAAVDAELGEECLARLERWKRTKSLGDSCVEDVYRIRMTRQHAEREGFPDECEKLHRIERELMEMTNQLRKEAQKLARRPE